MNVQHQISNILAGAFVNYPLMRYAFKGKTPEQKNKGLRNLYQHCTKAAALYGGTLINTEATASLIWLRGNAFPLGLWREIKSGMAAIPFKLGPAVTLRLMNHDAEPEGWITKNAGPNMGYIWCVGVNAAERGKGISRLIIEQSIRNMQSRGLSEFWLKTEDPVNVSIYQKLGFTIANQMQVKSSGLTSWMMVLK